VAGPLVEAEGRRPAAVEEGAEVVPGAASEPVTEADSEATPDEGGATVPEDGSRGRPVLMMGAVGAGRTAAPDEAGGTAAPDEAGGAGGAAEPEVGTAGGTAKPEEARGIGCTGKVDEQVNTVTVLVSAGAQAALAR